MKRYSICLIHNFGHHYSEPCLTEMERDFLGLCWLHPCFITKQSVLKGKKAVLKHKCKDPARQVHLETQSTLILFMALSFLKT